MQRNDRRGSLHIKRIEETEKHFAASTCIASPASNAWACPASQPITAWSCNWWPQWPRSTAPLQRTYHVPGMGHGSILGQGKRCSATWRCSAQSIPRPGLRSQQGAATRDKLWVPMRNWWHFCRSVRHLVVVIPCSKRSPTARTADKGLQTRYNRYWCDFGCSHCPDSLSPCS
jgi:hypothetical protein